MTTNQLTFRSTTFDIVDRNDGQIWITSAQLAQALEYSREDAVSRIYTRNADEFTANMAETVNLTVSGNLQRESRIFSLRGAHLVAMLGRTEVAKEFRKWTLDVLDHHVGNTTTKKQPKQKALPNGLSIEQQCSLKELVKARAEVLPKEKQGRALITCWSALKSKFGVSYKEIHPDNFIEALSLVSRLPLEGELMEREALPAPAAEPQFNDEQLQLLAWLWRASEYMLRTINDAYPTVMKAEYERASTFYSIQREYPRIIYQAQALLAAATAHVQYDQRVDNNWSRVLPVLRHVAIPRM